MTPFLQAFLGCLLAVWVIGCVYHAAFNLRDMCVCLEERDLIERAGLLICAVAMSPFWPILLGLGHGEAHHRAWIDRIKRDCGKGDGA